MGVLQFDAVVPLAASRRPLAEPLRWFGAMAVLAATSITWQLWAYPRYTDRTRWMEGAQIASAALVVSMAVLLARRRPDNPTWKLLVWFMCCGFLQDLGPPNPWLLVLPMAGQFLVTAAFMHLVLAYPSGRLPGRAERAAVAAAYLLTATRGLGDVLFAQIVWVRPRRELFHSALFLEGWDRVLPEHFSEVLEVGVQLIGAVGLVLLFRSAWRTRHQALAVRLPIVVSAIVSTAVFTVLALLPELEPDRWDHTVFFVYLALQSFVPLALGLGLLAQRRARAVVADLLLELDHTPLDEIEPLLARTLRDPSVELHYLDPGGGRLRSDGRTPAAAVGEGRAVTPVVTADGRRIAEIVGSTRPDDHPGLLAAVATAARFAIEHAALQAQLRAQVDELQASRERIVEAAASERRRIERNLHDGAQQQLLAVGMQLDQLRRRLRRVPNGMVRPETDALVLHELDGAITSLRATLSELQLLARGVHPPILTSRGLVPAVRSLLDRIPLPIELRAAGEHRAEPAGEHRAEPAGEHRAEPAVEATAYYVVSEGLGNALRHAGAASIVVDIEQRDTTLRVAVRDDGRGGADAGSDGLRSLADRVAAVGGVLRIVSPAGGGTTVEATLPCG